jgi:DNA-binding response OmpR family regulator
MTIRMFGILQYPSAQDLRITAVASGPEMLQIIADEPVDLFLLDRASRRRWGSRSLGVRENSAIPILILSGKAEEADCDGLARCYDYMTKLLRLRELLGIRAMRRSQIIESMRSETISCAYRLAGWELNLWLYRLTSPDGRRVELTNSESNLPARSVSAAARYRAISAERSRVHALEVTTADRRHDAEIAKAGTRPIQSGALAHRARRRLRLHGAREHDAMSVAVAMPAHESDIIQED